MNSTVVSILQALEDCGYTVLVYHRGRVRVDGIGWRTLGWADTIIQRNRRLSKMHKEG